MVRSERGRISANAECRPAASRWVSSTNAFMAASPNAVALAPANPPPNPLAPATPTTAPLTSTVVAVPSSTTTPTSSSSSTTLAAWSAWWSWLPSTATVGISTPASSPATTWASSGSPQRVRSPPSSSRSARSLTWRSPAATWPTESTPTWMSATAATRVTSRQLLDRSVLLGREDGHLVYHLVAVGQLAHHLPYSRPLVGGGGRAGQHHPVARHLDVHAQLPRPGVGGQRLLDVVDQILLRLGPRRASSPKHHYETRPGPRLRSSSRSSGGAPRRRRRRRTRSDPRPCGRTTRPRTGWAGSG